MRCWPGVAACIISCRRPPTRPCSGCWPSPACGSVKRSGSIARDIDWAARVLTIRESKFGKSRTVPVLESTLTALDRYAHTRDRLCPQPSASTFFVSMTGTRLIYQIIEQTFRRLCDSAGIGAGADRPPRIHDLRHTFAVRTLLGWYRAGDDIEARLPILSTYLGHRDPRSTYWYLSAAPELLALAATRLEDSGEVTSR